MKRDDDKTGKGIQDFNENNNDSNAWGGGEKCGKIFFRSWVAA